MGSDVNGRPVISIGDVLTCSETGKTFIAAHVGCTTNYARDSQNRVFSDEGVDICERRGLLDRSQPFFCYISGNGRSVTGWKGNVLGAAVAVGDAPVFHGRVICYRVTDVHGGKWYGRGAPGMAITLRAAKGG